VPVDRSVGSITFMTRACLAGHKEPIPVRSVVGDVRKLTELRIATRDVTTVIHAAGIVSFGTFPDSKAMLDVNAKGIAYIRTFFPFWIEDSLFNSHIFFIFVHFIM